MSKSFRFLINKLLEQQHVVLTSYGAQILKYDLIHEKLTNLASQKSIER